MGWTLGEPLGFPGERSAQALLLEFPYLLGYLALTWALLKTPGKPLRLTLLLLPLGLWGLLQALQGALGVDRLYIAWDALLLLLLLPRLEPLFQGRFLGDRALWGVGFLLILFADLAYAHLEAQGGYPVGHPVHLLWTWGYLLLALAPRLDPKLRGQPPQVWPWLLAAVVWAFALLQGAFLYASWSHVHGNPFPVERAILAAVGLIFLVLGLLLPRLPPNYLAGVRTPWTLGNPRVWRTTHLRAGSVFALLGLLAWLAALWGGRWLWVWLAALMAGGLYLVLFSYLAWRQSPGE